MNEKMNQRLPNQKQMKKNRLTKMKRWSGSEEEMTLYYERDSMDKDYFLAADADWQYGKCWRSRKFQWNPPRAAGKRDFSKLSTYPIRSTNTLPRL